MKYLSLFSGIGGFELGIQQAYEELQKLCVEDKGQSEGTPLGDSGRRSEQLSKFGTEGLSCIGYSEIDKYATKIYQSHFPEHKNYGDITKIKTEDLPEFDLLVGGFPCQSFSIAGKRGGFNDTRGTLFFEIARILKTKQPRLFLLENVKGLLSHDEGRTFRTIISTLDELGYDLQWQVLNSKNFGVPQNRERVFIVGHLRGSSRLQVFPFGENSSSVKTQIVGTTIGDECTRHGERDQVYGGWGLTGCLKATDYKQPPQLLEITENTSQGYRVYDPNGISTTIASQAGGLGAKTGLYKDKFRVRRLTPTECARLQGFPDDWHKIEGISDTQAYKCYGNAVTVNVIKEVAKRLIHS